MDKTKKDITTIVLADDHPLLRKGLKDIIDEENSLRVVGEAGDGEQALELIQQLKPDIAILDIHMPKLSGLEVVNKIQQQKLKVDIIILTMYDKDNIFNRAMDL
ncbi:MAG TPA: response regulator transcription factor, partial [Ignavibacteriaceae bacterium]|nr:response regulator transcription factor [Ignavibacteriaceae bacterium]